MTKVKIRWEWGLLCVLLSCSAPVDDRVAMREGAEKAFAEARSAVGEATESAQELPPGADTREAREVLDSDLETLLGDLADSARLLEEDRLVEASEAAVEVRREAEAIVLDVRRAAAVLPRSPGSGAEPDGPGGMATL